MGPATTGSSEVPTSALAPSSPSSPPTTVSPTTVPPTTVPPTTVPPPGFEASSLVAGDQHVCAIGIDSSTYCWGYNLQGQLGNGTNDDRSQPTLVQTDRPFASLTAGRYFTCGLSDGEASCWGDNSAGQLGNGESGGGGSDADSPVPVQVVTDLRFTALASGQLHVCGLTADAEVHCWGAGSSGQLGSASTPGGQAVPVRAELDAGIASLATGSDSNMCGLTGDGAAWCWGSNAFGQLGTGDKYNNSQPVPQAVGGGLVFEYLGLGAAFVCGLEPGGAVACWGSNSAGQLGDGTTEERLGPVPVDTDVSFASLAVGSEHVCGLDGDGVAYCWGSNAFGQLGDATSGGQVLTPQPVTGGLRFASLTAGEEFTCGIGSDGAAYCWGSNRSGWLGDGTLDPRLEPTRVLPPLAG